MVSLLPCLQAVPVKDKRQFISQRLLDGVEYRVTGGDTDLTHRYARELLALHPDALFATTNTSMAALHAEHSSIPTVFAVVSDPIGMHYVESFSRPGGNVTGFTPFEPSLGGKWVSLLKKWFQTSSISVSSTILNRETTQQRFTRRSAMSRRDWELPRLRPRSGRRRIWTDSFTRLRTSPAAG